MKVCTSLRKGSCRISDTLAGQGMAMIKCTNVPVSNVKIPNMTLFERFAGLKVHG